MELTNYENLRLKVNGGTGTCICLFNLWLSDPGLPFFYALDRNHLFVHFLSVQRISGAW